LDRVLNKINMLIRREGTLNTQSVGAFDLIKGEREIERVCVFVKREREREREMWWAEIKRGRELSEAKLIKN
jgi:hypothetical protein